MSVGLFEVCKYCNSNASIRIHLFSICSIHLKAINNVTCGNTIYSPVCGRIYDAKSLSNSQLPNAEVGTRQTRQCACIREKIKVVISVFCVIVSISCLFNEIHC